MKHPIKAIKLYKLARKQHKQTLAMSQAKVDEAMTASEFADFSPSETITTASKLPMPVYQFPKNIAVPYILVIIDMPLHDIKQTAPRRNTCHPLPNYPRLTTTKKESKPISIQLDLELDILEFIPSQPILTKETEAPFAANKATSSLGRRARSLDSLNDKSLTQLTLDLSEHLFEMLSAKVSDFVMSLGAEASQDHESASLVDFLSGLGTPKSIESPFYDPHYLNAIVSCSLRPIIAEL